MVETSYLELLGVFNPNPHRKCWYCKRQFDKCDDCKGHNMFEEEAHDKR